MKRFFDWLLGPCDPDDRIFRNTVACMVFLTFAICVLLALFLKKSCFGGIMTFLVAAAACFAGGGSIGFLFGLPKKGAAVKLEGKDKSAGDGDDYEDNTNLQEVSDWLTKLIVGLSLIKVKTILACLANASASIAESYKQECFEYCKGFDFYVFAYAIIVFYFLLGAGLIYLWSRTTLKGLLSRTRKLEKANVSLVGIIQDITNNNPEVNLTEKNLQPEEVRADISQSNFEALDEKNYNFRNQTEVLYNAKTIIYKDDLQKGRWGGKSMVSSKILEAVYNPSLSTVAGLYNISLIVRSVDPNNALTGEVAFFLHDTFRNPIRYTRAVNNKAEITVTAWEAFVVGARLEDGTELELDLNQIKVFPEGFYWK